MHHFGGARMGLRPTDAEPNRILAFNLLLYHYRNLVELFFHKLAHFRAMATRYDERDNNLLASVQLALITLAATQ